MQKNKIYPLIGLGVLILIFFITYPKKEIIKFNLGEIKDRQYTNNYFGVRLPVPPNWEIAANNTVLDEISFSDIKKPDERPKILLTLIRQGLEAESADQEANPSAFFVMVAHQLPQGHEAGGDYDYLSGLLHNSYSTSVVKPNNETISDVIFNSVEFYSGDGTEGKYDTIYNKYYLCRFRNYILLLLNYSTNDESNNSYREILNQIKFVRVKNHKISD